MVTKGRGEGGRGRESHERKHSLHSFDIRKQSKSTNESRKKETKGRTMCTLVPEVFFRREETRQGRERSGQRKPLVAGDANLIIMLQ